MTKYAMTVYQSEGISYYLPLEECSTLDEAVQAALEMISESDLFPHDDEDDLDFNIVAISNITEHNITNYPDFWEKKHKELFLKYEKQQIENEKAMLATLKAKYGE